jgi:hypothetical protein
LERETGLAELQKNQQAIDYLRGYLAPGAIRRLQNMTDHKKNLVINEGEPETEGTAWQRMPWQWKLGLVRILIAVALGFAGFLCFAYKMISGDYAAALGIALCVVVGVRLVGGALLDLGRK